MDQLRNRRQFVAASSALLATVSTLPNGLAMATTVTQDPQPFSMRFAPHKGMFSSIAGKDILDQIRFASDMGFTAWEHNGMADESPEMQEKIGSLLDKLRMRMGVFVAYASFDHPTFAVRKPEHRDEVLSKIKAAVEVAKRCGAKYCTVVPGSVDQQSNRGDSWNKYGGARLAPGYQTANVIDLLRECTAILEPHEIVMVLEPLNWYANHGGTFLQQSDQAFAICRAVNSPSCKILFDIYHQQITEGNLIPNIEMCWDEIGYFQSGDNPGRKEPGTGEINYGKVFKYIADRQNKEQKDFIIGMEHGNSMKGRKGAEAVIDAYRNVDPEN